MNSANRLRDYGGSPAGNKGTNPDMPPALCATGDPRSNNDALRIVRTAEETNPRTDISLYTRFASAGDVNRTPGLFNTNYSDPEKWADYYKFPAGAIGDAFYAVVPNRDFVSVAELGHVADPAAICFYPSPLSRAADPFLARGGARTLRIGQPDDLVDPNPASISAQQWAAWRLTDIFTADVAGGENTKLQLYGRININGILRDDGAALRMGLHGISFNPKPAGTEASTAIVHGAVQTSGKQLDDSGDPASGTGLLIALLKQRLLRAAPGTASQMERTWGPLWERGEISELDIFNGTTAGLLVGVDLAKTSDRGREELFRRLADLITTRGNTFSIYVIGQSVRELGGGRMEVLASRRMRVVVRLKPIYLSDRSNPSSVIDPENEDFVPTDDTTLAKRFASPARYDAEILHVVAGP